MQNTETQQTQHTPSTYLEMANKIVQLKAEKAELVAALHKIVAVFESDPDDLETMDSGIAIALAALAKATGSEVVK